MTVLTPTNLRKEYKTSVLYWSVHQPAILLDAQIADVSISRGDRTIAYDTGTGTAAEFGRIEAGQPLIFNGRKIRIKAISGNEVSGSIIAAENSEDWQDNDPITVTHEYPVFPFLPGFTTGTTTSTFTKDIGTGATGENYTDENLEPPPICNVGVLLFVDWYQGSNIIFDFDLSTYSYVIANGASISSYAAVVSPAAAGLTVSINAGTGAGDLTATQTGTWWVKFTVTDDNGKSQDTYRLVMTSDPIQSFDISNLTGDWGRGGWNYSISVTASASLTDIPDQTLVALWHLPKVDGTETYTDVWADGANYLGENQLCAGYLQRDNADQQLATGVGQVTFTVNTPEQQLSNVSEFGSVSLEAIIGTPSDWYEYSSWLTIGRGLHHLLRWHSSAFFVMDIWFLMRNTDGVKFLEFTEASLLQQAQNLAQNKGIKAKLVSSRLGNLLLERDIQLLNDAVRGALDTVFSVGLSDVGGNFTVVREPQESTLQTLLDGFSFDGTTSTPFISKAPGDASEDEGINRIKQSGQVLSDQTDANERGGRIHAVANAELVEVRPFIFRGDYTGAFDLACQTLGWYEFDLPNSTLKRGQSLNGNLMICRSISHSFGYANGRFTGKISTTVNRFEFEIDDSPDAQTETYPGQTAIQCPPGVGQNSPTLDPTGSDKEEDETQLPPVGILSFSSTEIRRLTDAAWTNVDSDSVNFGEVDPYWYLKAQSYNPDDLAFWLGESGSVQEVVGTGDDSAKTAISPSSNPPNTWTDAPAPVVATCEFEVIKGDEYEEDIFYTLVSFQDGASNWRGWLAKRTSGTTYSYFALYDQIALPAQAKPLGVAIGTDVILVTVWQDAATDKIKLLVFDKSPFTFNQEIDLGNTSLAELNSFEYWAWPQTTSDYSAGSPDDVAPWFIFGRMNAPAGLAGIVYAAKNNGSWATLDIKDDVGVDFDIDMGHISAFVAGPNDPTGREYWSFIRYVGL